MVLEGYLGENYLARHVFQSLLGNITVTTYGFYLCFLSRE